MTRDEIMAMVPGREMDALVAEKVMNLCVLDQVHQYGDGCVVSDKGFDEWMSHPEYGRIDDPDLLPPYSTDIAAAWEVMEKWGFQAQAGYQGGDYFCSIMYGFDGEGTPLYGEVGDCASAPEAICKAALLTLIEEETT